MASFNKVYYIEIEPALKLHTTFFSNISTNSILMNYLCEMSGILIFKSRYFGEWCHAHQTCIVHMRLQFCIFLGIICHYPMPMKNNIEEELKKNCSVWTTFIKNVVALKICCSMQQALFIFTGQLVTKPNIVMLNLRRERFLCTRDSNMLREVSSLMTSVEPAIG